MTSAATPSRMNAPPCCSKPLESQASRTAGSAISSQVPVVSTSTFTIVDSSANTSSRAPATPSTSTITDTPPADLTAPVTRATGVGAEASIGLAAYPACRAGGAAFPLLPSCVARGRGSFRLSGPATHVSMETLTT